MPQGLVVGRGSQAMQPDGQSFACLVGTQIVSGVIAFMQTELEQIAALLKKAKRILFITGAGVSAESGVPTFRGTTAALANGLPEEGLPFEDVLSCSTFNRNPKLSWKYLLSLGTEY